MKGKVASYKGGVHTQYTDRIIIIPEGVTHKDEAAKLIGKKVTWTTPSGKTITGEVNRVHGRKGTIIAKFEKGLPGQALGTEVDIL